MKIGYGMQFNYENGKPVKDGITVKELTKALVSLIQDGHENDKIMVSIDEEGNEFKPIYSLDCTAKGEITIFPLG